MTIGSPSSLHGGVDAFNRSASKPRAARWTILLSPPRGLSATQRRIPQLEQILGADREIADTELAARIEREAVQAAFVGAIVAGTTKAAAQRAPATLICASRQEAMQWVESEAAAIGIPVEWVARPER